MHYPLEAEADPPQQPEAPRRRLPRLPLRLHGQRARARPHRGGRTQVRNVKILPRIQGEQAAWTKPHVDIDVKVVF